MKKFCKYILPVSALVVLLATIATAQIRVVAQVDTAQDIYVGESFTYNIIIDGENKPGHVDLAPLAQFSPQSAGNRDVSQTSISIINGKTTRNVTKRFVMSYMLTADRAGEILVPATEVAVEGKIYKTNPVRVNILEPGTTDRLDFELKLSQKRCYVGQPITMTANFFCPADIGDFQFNIPVFKSEHFYFEDLDFIDPQAKQFRLSPAISEPAYVTQNRVVHKGTESVLLSFSKLLIPTKPGNVRIDAATVSAELPVGRVRSRDFFFNRFRTQYKRFMVSSQPLELDVLPLPAQPKPAGFYGLVGRYKISASAQPTKVNVGDPITLTIKIGGGYLKSVKWPRLEDVGQLAANFKIPSQQASPVLEDGYKVFTQTIRANNDKVTEIPPIPLAFFDADKGEYVVAKSEPIKLAVAPTKVLTAADLEGSEFTPVNNAVEAIRKGLSANYEGPDAVKDYGFSPLAAAARPGYLVILAVPFAVLVASFLIRTITQTSPEQIELRRRRRAAGAALGKLKTMSSAGTEQRYELLAEVMKQYVGQRFGRTAGSLTGQDCLQLITDATDDGAAAASYKETVEACEAGRYAAVQVNIDAEQIKRVAALIKTIEAKARKR